MADRSTLEAAAAAGVIAPEQVTPLLDFLSTYGQPLTAAPNGEEDLRFIRNFHDVFLATGIVLLAIGLAVAIGVNVSGAPNPRIGAFMAGGYGAGAAVVIWALGELFARRRRLFLPAIAIVCALTLFSVFSAASFYFGAVLGTEIKLDALEGVPPQVRTGLLVAAAFFVIAPLAFYARFRLPFSMGLTGAGAAGFVVIAVLLWNLERAFPYLPALNLTLGLLLFLAGVAFDARDPARQTRLSDNGFWLHFAAAPLLLNGAFGLTGQLFSGGAPVDPVGAMVTNEDAASAQAAATLVVVLLLGLVSLLINRRALIVSALLTTGVAIGVLMNAVGLDAGALAASTLIVLGGFVLILGAGWHSVRRALLGWVKPDGVWARIFPPETAATA